MNSERIEAILSATDGRSILNLGCVNHAIPLTDAKKGRWLHKEIIKVIPIVSGRNSGD